MGLFDSRSNVALLFHEFMNVVPVVNCVMDLVLLLGKHKRWEIRSRKVNNFCTRFVFAS